MVIGNHICIAIFRFIHFQVGVLPGELLPWINGLRREKRRRESGAVTAQRDAAALCFSQETCISPHTSPQAR